MGTGSFTGSGVCGGNGGPSTDSVVWAQFENCDANDPSLFSEDDSTPSGSNLNASPSTPPLFLVLGYTTGVQVSKTYFCIYYLLI